MTKPSPYAMLAGAAVVLLGGGPGCKSEPLRPGRIEVIRPGGPILDFQFRDVDGRIHSISEKLGDYTVIAFTRCETDTHVPTASALRDMVQPFSSHPSVKVVGINIHWLDGSPSEGECHVIEGQQRLMSICDATGAIHRLYGVTQEDWLFLIGPDHWVVAREPLSQAARMSTTLERAVNKLERDQDFETRQND